MLLQSSAFTRAARLHRGFASGAREFIGDKLSGASDKSQDTVQDAAKQAQESVQDKAEKVAHHVAANLPPQFVKFMNSGYLHAMKQLRDQVLKEEWLEHGQQAAKRAAIAQFEGKLAEEGRVSDAADPAPPAPSAQPPVPAAAGQQGQHAARTASRSEQEAEPASKPSSIDRQVQAEVAADQDSSPGPARQAAEGGGEQSSAHGGGEGGSEADVSVGGKGGGGSPPSGHARTRDSSSSSSSSSNSNGSSSMEGSGGKAAASAAGDGTRGGEGSEVQGSSGGAAGGGGQKAQEQSALPYSVITRLYQQPDKMDVIQDPVLRARLRSLMHTLLDEREREAYRDATNRAEDMASFFKSGPSSLLDALQSLLPLPGFLKSKS